MLKDLKRLQKTWEYFNRLQKTLRNSRRLSETYFKMFFGNPDTLDDFEILQRCYKTSRDFKRL